MKLGHILRRLVTMPPHIAVRKAARRWSRYRAARRARGRDQAQPTFLPEAPEGDLLRYLQAPPTRLVELHRDDIAFLVKHALAHRFNLLGSGWTDAGRRDNPVAAVNEANRDEAARIRGLIDASYSPIDWQRDLVSGHRWSWTLWYRDDAPRPGPGADIKGPWELSRMQHLPVLAWAHALAKRGAPGFEAAESYRAEFHNQVLDFIAANPPRFGANWRCTMDVAIRAAGWLVTYDLFRALGATFHAQFEAVFKRSIEEHARHIAANLEWDPDLRGNHYLADIVGLLFAAAWLPRSPQADAWLALGVQEFVAEALHQFGDDGAGFEASTCYHRLSAEMACYAAALIEALPAHRRTALRQYNADLVEGPPHLTAPPLPTYGVGSDGSLLPPEVVDRLARMAEFTIDATRPDGRVVQVGDNDNGRFLKLLPLREEDPLDHHPLVAALNGPFDRGDLSLFAADCLLETQIVRGLAPRGLPERSGAERQRLRAYPRFGLFAWRGGRFDLWVRCGPVGQDGNGGHAHNDQLSVTLSVAGRAVLIDPGTGVYTPDPARRNRFRSTALHNTLALDTREQNRWLSGPVGLFSMRRTARARVIEATDARFVGEHDGFGRPHRRTLEIGADRVVATDECEEMGEGALRFYLAPDVTATVDADGVRLRTDHVALRLRALGEWTITDCDYSPGYGVAKTTRVVVLHWIGPSMAWSIELA